MTSRSDLPRLGAATGLLGTLIEMRGQEAHDVTWGWENGPIQIARPGPRGGGGVEGDEDRRAEIMQRIRAAKVHQQIRDFHNDLDKIVQQGLKLYDVAFPGHPAELRNKRTDSFDPITPADVAADGWCASCWRNDQQMVAREKNKRGMYYSSTMCRWCQGVKATYDVEPPLEMLKLHHAGRRISEQMMREAVEEAKAKQPKKGKGKKGKKAKGKAA